MRRRFVFTGLVFMALFGSAILLLTRRAGSTQEVKTSRASRGDVIAFLSTSGTVESKHRREYFVFNPSRVEKVNVKAFNRVKKGDILVQLETEDLSLKIEAAGRQYENAKLLLEKLKSQRESSLYEGLGSVPASSIQGGMVTYNDIKMQENTVEIARINLETLRDLEEKQQKYIKADIDGVVAAINVTEGGAAGPQLPAVIVEDVSSLQIALRVNQYDITSIKVNQEASIKVNKNVYSGRVEGISPVAVKTISQAGSDTNSRVIIKITDNVSGLKPGFETDVNIKIGERKGVLKIPTEAVLRDKNGNEMALVIENNKISVRRIKTGLMSDQDVEILGGLEINERVVLNPLPGMKDGERVKIID